MCQAALNGGTIDSAPAVIDVRYLKQPHVVDTSGQGPILIASQVMFFIHLIFYCSYYSKNPFKLLIFLQFYLLGLSILRGMYTYK